MYAVACSVLCGAQAMAQTAYDAVRYAGDELNGTARFVGMGGPWVLWVQIFRSSVPTRRVSACSGDTMCLRHLA